MKKMIRSVLAVLLIAAVLGGTALAASYTDYYQIDGVITGVSGDSNIRTMPSLAGETIGVLPNGCMAEYLCGSSVDVRGVSWYLVQYDGMVGWVSEKYVQRNATPSSQVYMEGDSEYPVYDYGTYEDTTYISSYGTVVATGGDTNIRSWADTESDLIGVLPKGQAATYRGSSYTDDRGVRWDFIEYRDMTGWVSSRYTTLYS